MALTQVRAQFNGAWYTLTYNSATQRYEGSVIPTAISAGQPGGYFPVTVEAVNQSGRVTAASGSTMPSLRLVVHDTLAPVLVVAAPADGLVTAAAGVTVSGTASDTSGLSSVTVNGTPVSVSADGSFSQPVSLSGGVNTITVRAADNAGNVTVETRTVTRATAGPVLDITSPAEGALVQTASLTVSGTVSDKVSPVAGVTVNGAAAAVSGGTWTVTAALGEGRNILTVVAVNQVGLSTAVTRSVFVDSIPPALTVTVPAGDLITNQPQLTVTGAVSDSGTGVDRVTVNGQAVEVAGGAFSLALTLSEGSNTITVSASDRAGHVTTAVRSVLLDTVQPVLTLVSPPEGYISENRPEVVFAVSDEAGGSGLAPDTVKVYLDSVLQTAGAAVSGGEIRFTPPSVLADGAHIVTVTVEDQAGNRRGLSAAYTVDTVPPTLYIQRPYMRHVVDDAAVEVAVDAWDGGAGISGVTAGAAALAPVGAGRYAGVVPLAVGENRIAVAASDRAGNVTAGEVYLIRLVTDRSAADTAALAALMMRTAEEWTAAELAWFNTAVQRGAYNSEDLNRVGVAVRWLAGELERRGHIAGVPPETDWAQGGAPTAPQMEAYLAGVNTVREAQRLEMPEVPETMRGLDIDGANQIEAALVAVDAVFPRYGVWTSGEIGCGEC